MRVCWTRIVRRRHALLIQAEGVCDAPEVPGVGVMWKGGSKGQEEGVILGLGGGRDGAKAVTLGAWR